MDANELRALADALSEGVHWSDPITPEMLAEAIKRFCADAQPVAMLASHRRLIEQAIHTAEHPSGMSTHDGKARIDASILRRMLAIIDSSPAAPQAEPKREPLSDEQIELPDYLRLQIASTAAAHDVLVERRRQIESEGWAPEHDDEHSKGQLAAAAACYALSSIGIKGNEDVQIRFWPWDDGWWRPSNRRRNLVKAGALILAEIERLDRMGGSDAE